MNFALDLAESINDMADRLAYLERENAHLKALLDIYQKGEERQAEHHRETMGMIFTAVLDPDSKLNKMTRIVAKAKLAGIEA